MNNKKPLLLCLSDDPKLLELRRRVLALRYEVIALRTVDEMKALPPGSAFDLLVICHTIPAEECTRAIHLARSRWPDIKLLAIITKPMECQGLHADASVGSLDGPVRMLDGVSHLLEQPAHYL